MYTQFSVCDNVPLYKFTPIPKQSRPVIVILSVVLSSPALISRPRTAEAKQDISHYSFIST